MHTELTEVIYFLNELDLLEAHLEQHSKYKWPIYIAESRKTVSGIDKPLFYLENKHRFDRFDLRHIEIPSYLYDTMIKGPTELQYKQFRHNDWQKRLWIQDNLKVSTPWVFHSDVDEILNKVPELDTSVDYVCLMLNQYMAQVNRRVSRTHDAYRIAKSKLTVEQLQAPKSVKRATLQDMGWHFTHCPSSAEELRLKAQCRPWYFDVTHPDLVPDLSFFESMMGKSLNFMSCKPLGSNTIVDLSELPDWMRINKHMFPIADKL